MWDGESGILCAVNLLDVNAMVIRDGMTGNSKKQGECKSCSNDVVDD